MKEAKAKVQARRKDWRKDWRQGPYRISKPYRATSRAKSKKAKGDDARPGEDDATPDFMLYSPRPSRRPPFGLFGGGAVFSPVFH